MLVAAKTFSKQPLEPISIDSSFDLLFGYRKSQTWQFPWITADQHGQAVILNAATVLENLLELSGRNQS